MTGSNGKTTTTTLVYEMLKAVLQNQNVLVLGLAKSGYAAASILHEKGVKVVVNDQLPFEENEPARILAEKGVEVVCGSHPTELFDLQLSVILQVISFKTTGKRIFKMSPLHHHYELVGWSEWRVVVTFWTAGLLLAVLGIYIEVWL
ncbi:hypothetical protein DT075_23595 [Bacillus licheniformis]|nr:hypothetical protein DT075_23595 [Bacillus licheniformis]